MITNKRIWVPEYFIFITKSYKKYRKRCKKEKNDRLNSAQLVQKISQYAYNTFNKLRNNKIIRNRNTKNTFTYSDKL